MVLCRLDASPWFCNRIWKSRHVISRYVPKDRTRLYFSYPYSNIQFLGRELSAGSKFQFGYLVDEVSTGKLRRETLEFSCELPHNDPIEAWHVVHSCNGLVCLVTQPVRKAYCHNTVVCVCNPILREWISIPIPDGDCVCALGFSANNNQYKILMCITSGDVFNLTYEWKIYTLGTGHWRSIETKEKIRPWFLFTCLPFNTFTHGSLHWTPPSAPFVVQSFNFETERFTVFSLPERESAYLKDKYISVELGVINGCLWASFHNGYENDDVEMWAMKEYGDEKSWTMTLALRRDNYSDHKYDIPEEVLLARHKELVIYKEHISHHKLLFTLNGEEIVISEVCKGFICYNIKTMRSRYLNKRIGYVSAYNPSFVSLHDVGRGEKVTRGKFPGKCDKFGGYKCADCGSPRYKFGCGWPAFFEGLPGAINRTKDPDGWRTEISCRACGAPCVQRGGGYR